MAVAGALALALVPASPARATTAAGPPLLAYSTTSQTQQHSIVTLRSGTRRQLASSTHPLLLDAWSTNGEIYYSVLPVACVRDCHGRVDAVPDQGGAARTAVASGEQLTIDGYGKTIVYSDGGQLWRRPLAGATATRLTGAGGLSPVLSPDGKRILFSRPVTGNGALVTAIFVMPLAGGTARRLTAGSTLDIAGAWSPDGRRVLFTRDEGTARPTVYSVYVDGSGLRRVATDAHDPAWASTGWVAYAARRGDDQWSLVVRPPGGSERVLVHAAGADVDGVRFLAGG